MYNSARVHNSNPTIFKPWIKYILRGEDRPVGISVYLRLVIPHKLTKIESTHLPKSIREAGEIVPYISRIINPVGPTIEKYGKILSVFRTISINSYYFNVLIPNYENYLRPAWRQTLQEIQTNLIPESYHLKSEVGSLRISASRFDSVDVMEDTIIANLGAYHSKYSRGIEY
jgi:hypothetical protein